MFNGFNTDYSQDGRTVELRITVYDSNQRVVDSLTEKRTMDSSGCARGVLFYGWIDGRLHRVN